jgi:hypothetical protein
MEYLTEMSNPRIVFHWADQKPDPKVRYSAFFITTRSGEQFIADFTIEQFGFEPGMWFMKRENYAKECTLDEPVSKPSEEELDEAWKGMSIRGWG